MCVVLKTSTAPDEDLDGDKHTKCKLFINVVASRYHERLVLTSTVSRFWTVAVEAGATRSRAASVNVLSNCIIGMKY